MAIGQSVLDFFLGFYFLFIFIFLVGNFDYGWIKVKYVGKAK